MEFSRYFSIVEFLLLVGLISIISVIVVMIKRKSRRPYHDELMVDADLDDHSEGWLRRVWNNFLNLF